MHDAEHSAPTPITLLLVDDHPVVRKGTRELLEGEADLRVNGSKLRLTSIPDAEWATVEERARAFWDEIAAESETKARVARRGGAPSGMRHPTSAMSSRIISYVCSCGKAEATSSA